MPSRIHQGRRVAQGEGVAVIHPAHKADLVRDRIWKEGIHQGRWVGQGVVAILRGLVREMDSLTRRGHWVDRGAILRDRVRVRDNLILPGSKVARGKVLIRLDQEAAQEQI